MLPVGSSTLADEVDGLFPTKPSDVGVPIHGSSA